MTFNRNAACRSAAWAAALVLSTSCQIPNNPMRAGVPAGGSPSLTHNLVLAGQAHSDGLCRPADNCSACHGADLKGGSGGQPSCFSCHADLWNRLDCGKGTSSHTINLGGKLHAPDYCHPSLSCAGCHGADLQGGPNAAPSCTSCHGTKWNDPNCGRNTHSVNLGGVYHADQYCRPYQSCVACHGASLRGGSGGEPSCLTCHNQRAWMDCGATLHNDIEEGVRHARNKNRPATDCAPCHGADLRGGPNNEPSCYKCHGKEW